MKKYIIGISLLALVSACKQDKETGNNLQQQKVQIEQQIDSLHQILEKINAKLGDRQAKEIPGISAIKVSPAVFTHYIELQGNVDTDGNVMVIPEVMGSVKKIYKNEGDKVRKGQTILLLDDAVLRNQISEIRTQYSLAKTAYDRQKRLWDQKIGSEMAYLQAKTKKESLVRKLQTLKSQLAKFYVKAPISGTLDDLMIKEGEMAAPQRPVARVVNLDQVYVQADVSEKYLTKIKKRTPAIIVFPEINKSLKAQIGYVGNFIHPNNRTFKIRINLRNTNGDLKPNLTGNIKIKDLEENQAIVLPLSIVQEDRAGDNFVYILQPVDKTTGIYKTVKRKVVLGPNYKGRVWIKSGLKPNDIVAGKAARGLTEGDQVKITNADKLIQVSEKQRETKSQADVKPFYHKVKKGETLFRIHQHYKVSLADLRKWNHLKNDRVKVGQKLIVQK